MFLLFLVFFTQGSSGDLQVAETSTVWQRCNRIASDDSIDDSMRLSNQKPVGLGLKRDVDSSAWIATLARHVSLSRQRTGPARFVTLYGDPGVGWLNGRGTQTVPWEDTLAHVLPGPLLRGDAVWGVVPRVVLEKIAANPAHRTAVTQHLSNRVRGVLERRVERARTQSQGAQTDGAALSHLGTVACAFAEAGGFVLVGRGLAWLTRACAGGLHTRLISPWSQRVTAVADTRELTPREASEHMGRIERRRAAWQRRFWPEGDPTATYGMTFNTAALSPSAVALALSAGLSRDETSLQMTTRPTLAETEPEAAPASPRQSVLAPV